jgi:hypothetical protein
MQIALANGKSPPLYTGAKRQGGSTLEPDPLDA